MKFIDLFAGLGGFHVALSQLGHKCVFASEINEELRELYIKNFNQKNVAGDIRKVNIKDIPSHDLLCAGFPCQPFSHAGRQQGLHDKKNGNLFREIIKILKYHKPKYILLENVANLLNHDKGNTRKEIKKSLEEVGYNIRHNILSPHEFGIPHNRKRIFIVGIYRKKIDSFSRPAKQPFNTSVLDILDEGVKSHIPTKEKEILDLRQEFLQAFPKSVKLPSFPIRSTEFGATYPYEETCIFNLKKTELNKYKGAFGEPLNNLSYEEKLKLIPKYALYGLEKEDKKYPRRKIKFIEQNRKFYKENEKIIKPFLKRLKKLPLSFQKFERNCQGAKRDIYSHIIQFRASGVRIKTIKTSPALISSTSSQIPIIGPKKRYITEHEASKLQGLGSLKNLPPSINSTFRALGNAVNADLVRLVASELLKIK